MFFVHQDLEDENPRRIVFQLSVFAGTIIQTSPKVHLKIPEATL